MFTGIVQKTGILNSVRRGANGGFEAEICCSPWEDDPYRPGESIAVDGACLTLVRGSDGGFAADVLDETYSVTTLGLIPPGSTVNLERAMRPTDRFGGHIVAGHVDAVGRIASIRREGRDTALRITVPRETARFIVHKGSVAVDGTSLTITGCGGDYFEVCIIPTTFSETSLGSKHEGDPVNIETDMLARYIWKFMQPGHGEDSAGSLTLEKLASAGFPVR